MAISYITVKDYIKNCELKIDLPENATDSEEECHYLAIWRSSPIEVGGY